MLFSVVPATAIVVGLRNPARRVRVGANWLADIACLAMVVYAVEGSVPWSDFIHRVIKLWLVVAIGGSDADHSMADLGSRSEH